MDTCRLCHLVNLWEITLQMTLLLVIATGSHKEAILFKSRWALYDKSQISHQNELEGKLLAKITSCRQETGLSEDY